MDTLTGAAYPVVSTLMRGESIESGTGSRSEGASLRACCRLRAAVRAMRLILASLIVYVAVAVVCSVLYFAVIHCSWIPPMTLTVMSVLTLGIVICVFRKVFSPILFTLAEGIAKRGSDLSGVVRLTERQESRGRIFAVLILGLLALSVCAPLIIMLRVMSDSEKADESYKSTATYHSQYYELLHANHSIVAVTVMIYAVLGELTGVLALTQYIFLLRAMKTVCDYLRSDATIRQRAVQKLGLSMQRSRSSQLMASAVSGTPAGTLITGSSGGCAAAQRSGSGSTPGSRVRAYTDMMPGGPSISTAVNTTTTGQSVSVSLAPNQA